MSPGRRRAGTRSSLTVTGRRATPRRNRSGLLHRRPRRPHPEHEERIRHRRREEPLVPDELVQPVADRRRPGRVRADVRSALLLGHAHADEARAPPGPALCRDRRRRQASSVTRCRCVRPRRNGSTPVHVAACSPQQILRPPRPATPHTGRGSRIRYGRGPVPSSMFFSRSS